MKRLLLPLIAALALPTAVNANVDPEVHNLCKDVKDYIGCVKANSKKGGWNPFKKTANDKKSKNSFQLTKAQKEEWCEYSEWIDYFPKGVSTCVENLEILGPKILSISLEKHRRCNPAVSASPEFSTYTRCLEINADEYLLSILERFSKEDRDKITKKQWEGKDRSVRLDINDPNLSGGRKSTQRRNATQTRILIPNVTSTPFVNPNNIPQPINHGLHQPNKFSSPFLNQESLADKVPPYGPKRSYMYDQTSPGGVRNCETWGQTTTCW